MALVAALAAASDNEGNRLIMIVILSGGSGIRCTCRGDPILGTVGEAYILSFREFSY